ncbi:MAG TPA: ANTAR domain-containing protein [Clostridiaceae bacterium]
MDNYKILVADSDRKNGEMICTLLIARGYKVYQAHDSGETLRISRSLFPDLVIIDVNLIGVNAFKTARILEEDKVSNVIFISNNVDSEFYEQLKNMNIFAYVIKPIIPEQLYQTVEFSINNVKKFNDLQLKIMNLEIELKNRKLIDKAKGIVMERLKVSEDEAYKYLRKKSMDLSMSMYNLSVTIIKKYG